MPVPVPWVVMLALPVLFAAVAPLISRFWRFHAGEPVLYVVPKIEMPA